MHSGINSEHILLSLITTPGTIAYELLSDHLINVDQVRLVLSLRGRETTLASGISPFAKHIIELATQFSFEYQHSKVDAEHLLLAIVSYPECLAFQIIVRIGVDPGQIRKQIIKLFDELQNLDSISPEDYFDANDQPLPMARPAAPNAKNKKSSPLEFFATNLTQLARAKKLDPVIGREIEIQRLVQILTRRSKNNPVLIGEPGVGKTAIVEGLANKIVRLEVPSLLSNREIYQLDLALVIAGTTFRGQFEDRLKKILDEVKKNPNIILFIDELHTIVGAGAAEGSLDTANIIKPALSKGEIRLIGATTTNEYRKSIEKDAALERRLQKILVPEATQEETIKIIEGVKNIYEKHHQVVIDKSAVIAAVTYSQRFIQERFLPDKAIDLIDEAAAAANLKMTPPKGLSAIQNQLAAVMIQKEKAFASSDFEKAAFLRQKELDLTKQKNKFAKIVSHNKIVIREQNIADVVTLWTGIPVGKIMQEEQKRLLNLENELKKYVVGQNEAIKVIASSIKRAKTGVSNPSKPLGSFIFLGPTGVGKTYLAQTLANLVYASEDALIKVDMSEFMEKHNISRLIGAPPGYIGFEEAGKLTEAIRRQPFSVVLFDEIEKAHPEVMNILLQILEDGILTDGSGKQVSFKNSIIIMTSNIGSHLLTNQAAIGFKSKTVNNSRYQSLKLDVQKELESNLKPELINRIDKVIFFNPLSQSSIQKITEIELKNLSERVSKEGYKLDFKKPVSRALVQKGFNPIYGVRQLKRTITEMIEDKLADFLLSGHVDKKEKIIVDVRKGMITVSNIDINVTTKKNKTGVL